MPDEKNTNEVPPAETKEKPKAQELTSEELNLSGGQAQIICGACGVNPCTCNTA